MQGESLGHPTFIPGLFTEGLQCPLTSETHAFSMRILQSHMGSKSTFFLTILKDAWGWGTKAAHYFCSETLLMSHTRDINVSPLAIGLYHPKGSAPGPTLCPLPTESDLVRLSWKALRFPGYWEETATSCPWAEHHHTDKPAAAMDPASNRTLDHYLRQAQAPASHNNKNQSTRRQPTD